MALMTIFTAPKPFINPHIRLIQRNALRAWRSLPDTQVLVMGDEPGIAEAAGEFGVTHIPEVPRNAQGTPLVSGLFDLARQHSDSPLLCYANADILLFEDFIQAAQRIAQPGGAFLGVGQRLNLDVQDDLAGSMDWQNSLRQRLQSEGRLCGPTCIDYFVFRRDSFTAIPPLAIGRAGWDNWMIYAARSQSMPVIDLTGVVIAGHQNHDYSHLPGGKIHHQLPESLENIRLGGGYRTIFTIADATHRIVNNQISPIPLTWKRFWRQVEVYPLLRWRSFALANLIFAILHPKRAFGVEWRPQLSRWKRKLLGQPPIQNRS